MACTRVSCSTPTSNNKCIISPRRGTSPPSIMRYQPQLLTALRPAGCGTEALGLVVVGLAVAELASGTENGIASARGSGRESVRESAKGRGSVPVTGKPPGIAGLTVSTAIG